MQAKFAALMKTVCSDPITESVVRAPQPPLVTTSKMPCQGARVQQLALMALLILALSTTLAPSSNCTSSINLDEGNWLSGSKAAVQAV